MDLSAICLVVRGMGFHCPAERSQLKVYFHFPVLPIRLRLVVRGTAPAVRFRFVPLPSAIPDVVGGICFRFLIRPVGRCIGERVERLGVLDDAADIVKRGFGQIGIA